jgi:RND family efflux transporter MFP subunit
LIARLDCRDFELAVERAEAATTVSRARARLAELQHSRSVKLAGDGFLSKDALDSRIAELEASRAEVEVNTAAVKTARAALSKCEVRAPFPAIVLERLAQEGEMATPGAPLVSLLDTSRIEVKAEVQQTDAASLASARNPALVTGDGRYPLRLVRLSPALNKSSRLGRGAPAFHRQSRPPRCQWPRCLGQPGNACAGTRSGASARATGRFSSHTTRARISMSCLLPRKVDRQRRQDCLQTV